LVKQLEVKRSLFMLRKLPVAPSPDSIIGRFYSPVQAIDLFSHWGRVYLIPSTDSVLQFVEMGELCHFL
jgi:hypothetical protein